MDYVCISFWGTGLLSQTGFIYDEVNLCHGSEMQSKSRGELSTPGYEHFSDRVRVRLVYVLTFVSINTTDRKCKVKVAAGFYQLQAMNTFLTVGWSIQ